MDARIKIFVSLVERNGDGRQWDAILVDVEKSLCARDNRRRILIETARPIQDIKQKLSNFFKENDVVREAIVPELLGGVRISINDEEQFDSSLERKIKRLFK